MGAVPVPQLPLTKAEQATLAVQLAAAKSVITEFPTVKQAVAAGYAMSTVYVPCIGAHYTNVGVASHFDPGAPVRAPFRGYEPRLQDRRAQLPRVARQRSAAGLRGTQRPLAPAQRNGGLCLKGGVVVAGEESTRQECAALGGRKTLLTDVWMVHAWVVHRS